MEDTSLKCRIALSPVAKWFLRFSLFTVTRAEPLLGYSTAHSNNETIVRTAYAWLARAETEKG